MPNTYTQIHIHTVFAVQNRISLISKSWEQCLYHNISWLSHKIARCNEVQAMGNTASEIMKERADSSKQKLGLTLPNTL